MKLFTFARTEKSYSPKGDDYGDVQTIRRFGPHFPPVFLSVESAKAWQEQITNPLTNEDLLARFHWAECQIVELELQGGLITKVEAAAVAFANAFTAENDDAAEVERTVHALIAELENAGLRAV